MKILIILLLAAQTLLCQETNHLGLSTNLPKLQIINYYTYTNHYHYYRVTNYISALPTLEMLIDKADNQELGSTNLIESNIIAYEIEKTNAPAAIMHCIVFGQNDKKLFTLYCQQFIDNSKFNGWHRDMSATNALTSYYSGTFIE